MIRSGCWASEAIWVTGVPEEEEAMMPSTGMYFSITATISCFCSRFSAPFSCTKYTPVNASAGSVVILIFSQIFWPSSSRPSFT